MGRSQATHLSRQLKNISDIGVDLGVFLKYHPEASFDLYDKERLILRKTTTLDYIPYRFNIVVTS